MLGSTEIILVNYLEPAFVRLRRVWFFVPNSFNLEMIPRLLIKHTYDTYEMMLTFFGPKAVCI